MCGCRQAKSTAVNPIYPIPGVASTPPAPTFARVASAAPAVASIAATPVPDNRFRYLLIAILLVLVATK